MRTTIYDRKNQHHYYNGNFHYESRSNRSSPFPFVIYILLVIGYATFFSFWQLETVPLEVHLLSTLVMATCSIPFLIWYRGGRQGLPVFEMICLSYLLQFSLPIYTQPAWLVLIGQQTHLSWSAIYQALLYVELGIIAFILSYYLFRAQLSSSKLPTLDLQLDPKRRTLYIVSALLLGGFVNFYLTIGGTSFQSLAAILRVISLQMNIALLLISGDIFSRREQRLSFILLFYGATGISIINGLTTGVLESALAPVAALLLVYWHMKRKIPWLLMIVSLFCVIILNSAKSEYRKQVWFGGENYTFYQRVEIWEDLIWQGAKVWADPSAQEVRQNNINTLFFRFDLIHKFAHFVQLTPTFKPYYYGKTYSYFLYAWIPRVVWPGKPIANAVASQVEIDYYLKLPGQPVSQGLGQLPEAYINFGIIGVLMVMAIQGALFAIFDSILNQKDSEGGRAIYLTLMIYFLNGIGSVAAILWGALIQNIVVSAFILRYFSKGHEAIQLQEQLLVPQRLSTQIVPKPLNTSTVHNYIHIQ